MRGIFEWKLFEILWIHEVEFSIHDCLLMLFSRFTGFVSTDESVVKYLSFVIVFIGIIPLSLRSMLCLLLIWIAMEATVGSEIKESNPS